MRNGMRDSELRLPRSQQPRKSPLRPGKARPMSLADTLPLTLRTILFTTVLPNLPEVHHLARANAHTRRRVTAKALRKARAKARIRAGEKAGTGRRVGGKLHPTGLAGLAWAGRNGKNRVLVAATILEAVNIASSIE